MKQLQILKQKGCRITSARKAILAILTTHPLSVQEISQLMRDTGKQVDLASIYRTMELFVSIGLVDELDLGEGKSGTSYRKKITIIIT